MIRKPVSTFLSIFLIILMVCGIETIKGKNDDLVTLDAIPSSNASKSCVFSDNTDLIVDLLQNINMSLYLSYLENIVAFGPRRTGTTSCYNSGTYLYNEFQSMGLSVRYHEWNNGGYQDRNIEATLPGTNQTSDELYLIFGHYDTVSNCPGADDDASGVSTVLMAASLLSHYTFEHTIRFVAFSGEEQWMLGSHEYVLEALQNGDNIVAVLNVDMIGYALTPTHANNIKIYDNGNPRWVTNFTINMSLIYYDYIQLTALPSGYADSDQTYFWEYGFEGIFYHEYKFNDYYHTSQDIIDHLNLSYALKCSRLSIATLAALAEIHGGVNTPPETPDTPQGPTEGKTNIEYIFSTQTVDPDAQQIYYRWSWGDGISEWMGPYASGESVQAKHTWTTKGIYEIKAIAKDTDEAMSNWSDPLTISIVGRPIIQIGTITGGFGVHAELINIGDIDAKNVQWMITLQGLIFFGKEHSGLFVTVAAGSKSFTSTGFILGIGRIDITISATADGISPVEKHVTAFVIGPFVARVK